MFIMKVSEANDMTRRIDDLVSQLNGVFFEASHAGLRIDTKILEHSEISGVITPMLTVITYIQPHRLEK